MQHLNIPLKRHTKTTPPFAKGGVVWLLVGLLMVGGFLAYRAGALWFNRGAILSLAPSDTIFAIQLQLNQRTAPFLLDWLDGVPLLSDRSLELQDLAPYVRGDFAIFITKDGQRSVAIRANEESLPADLLSQLSIVTQKQGSFMLLSSTLVPISGVTSFPSPILPSIGKTWLGRVVMPQDELGGSLFMSSKQLTLELETDKRTTREGKLLPEAAIAMSGLSWGEDGLFLPGLQRLVSEGSLILKYAQDIDLAVVPSQSGLETLLKIKAPGVTPDDLIRELEKMGAFARPTITTQILPDGSELEEILVQPDLVSVEEISTAAGTSYRVPVGGGVYILAMLDDGTVLFSNSQTLLENYVGATPGGESVSCMTSSNRLNSSFLMGQAVVDHLQPQLGFFSEVFDNFSAISFEFKKYSTVVHFCRI